MLFTAHRADDIQTALRLAREFNLDARVHMATEGYLLADELKKADVPVVVHPTMQRASTLETFNGVLADAARLGITVIASFVGASWGITEMTFLAPVLVQVALKFGPSEVCSLMLLGLLAGSTLARGSPVKGVAMTVFGLLLGIVGADIETGTPRFAFSLTELDDGELRALVTLSQSLGQDGGNP